MSVCLLQYKSNVYIKNTMNPLFDIRLRWYDDTSLNEDDKRKLSELFLKTLGVTSEVAVDIFEALLTARADNRAITVREIKQAVVENRKQRGCPLSGLTERNIQIWMKFFRDIGLIKYVEKMGDRYIFPGNKKPSEVFEEYTKPQVASSLNYIKRVLEKTEDAYGV